MRNKGSEERKQRLRHIISNLPSKPGSYQFYDSEGKITSLSIQELRSTLDLAEQCITDSEALFTSIGHGEVFENPVE